MERKSYLFDYATGFRGKTNDGRTYVIIDDQGDSIEIKYGDGLEVTKTKSQLDDMTTTALEFASSTISRKIGISNEPSMSVDPSFDLGDEVKVKGKGTAYILDQNPNTQEFTVILEGEEYEEDNVMIVKLEDLELVSAKKTAQYVEGDEVKYFHEETGEEGIGKVVETNFQGISTLCLIKTQEGNEIYVHQKDLGKISMITVDQEEYVEGESVEVWDTNSRYYHERGVVKEKHPDGFYEVEFSDGGIEKFFEDYLHKESSKKTAQEEFTKGDKVVVTDPGDPFYEIEGNVVGQSFDTIEVDFPSGGEAHLYNKEDLKKLGADPTWHKDFEGPTGLMPGARVKISDEDPIPPALKNQLGVLTEKSPHYDSYMVELDDPVLGLEAYPIAGRYLSLASYLRLGDDLIDKKGMKKVVSKKITKEDFEAFEITSSDGQVDYVVEDSSQQEQHTYTSLPEKERTQIKLELAKDDTIASEEKRLDVMTMGDYSFDYHDPIWVIKEVGSGFVLDRLPEE